MIKTLSYCFVLLVVVINCMSCSDGNEMPSLEETYSKNDKRPFGSYVAYQYINQLFYQNDVKTKKTAAEKSLADNNDTSALYINISKNFYLSSADLDAVLSFVKKGNSMFVSSENFDSSFLQQLNIAVNTRGLVFDFFNSMRYTSVSLHPSYFGSTNSFAYYYLPLSNTFKLQESNSRVLGINESGDPDFIVVFYGSGRFYLHCEPRVFSNYFLLQKDNYKYMQSAFSYMPAIPDHVWWDDFYNRRNTPPSAGEKSNGSGLSVIMQHPPLASAFWLTLLLLLLYILFGGKRKQRIIRPLQPNVNNSVAFTETVSRLYLQNKDNRNMADKMITYFFEHLRNQYFISTTHMSGEFCSILSRKSNVPMEKVEALVKTISDIQKQDTISDQQLLSLNHQIENFYKFRQ